MNLQLSSISNLYTNKSQSARIITESWVENNCYCPNCSSDTLQHFTNNKPVGDFYCNNCKEEYELKSKVSNTIGSKIVDGAYRTMIERINSENNPSFFFLSYSSSLLINNFIIIPKHFFISDIIEKRKPLSETARRAGWIGCNIDLSSIPETGRIFIIKNSEVISKEKVREKWNSGEFLKTKHGDAKGWILDILKCVDLIQEKKFSLQDIYKYEKDLSIKHPDNKHIKDKIRQQLQILRDKNLIEFLGNGKYQKVSI